MKASKILIFILVTYYILFFFHAFAWWNTSFPYRKEITINNSLNSNNLTDYQIPINITYNSNMQPDFDDLRFTWYNSSSGKEQKIPYWIENYSSSQWAYIWIKVPYIPANTTDYGYGNGIQKIWMYYGNPNVVNESNGTLTFEFFDSFEDGTLTDKWEDVSQSGVTPSVNTNRAYHGIYSLDLPSAAGTNTINQVQTLNTTNGNLIYEVYINKYADGGDQNNWMFCAAVDYTSQRICLFGSSYYNPALRLREYDSSGTNINDWGIGNDVPTGIWKWLFIIVNDTYIIAGSEDVNTTQTTTQNFSSMDLKINLLCNGWGGGNNIDCAFDYVKVRKYTSPEPIVTESTIEEKFGSINLSSCYNLSVDNVKYYLTQDIIDSSASTCISIEANNITFDCQGHTIDGKDTLGSYGIYVYRNTITNTNISVKNCVVSDWNYGIYIYNSNSNEFANITAYSNSVGIYLINSKSNTINNSKIYNNQYGIYLYSAGDNGANLIYNNFFKNSDNIYFSSTIYTNYWNSTKQLGTNIIDRNIIAGNYWAKPDSAGYSQTCLDKNYDGICDYAYDIIYDRACGEGTDYACSNNTDYLPLTIPKIIKISIIHSSQTHGKNSLLNYVYYLYNQRKDIISLLLETGMVALLQNYTKNISLWASENSKIFLIFTSYRTKNKFDERAELAKTGEYLNYGKFTFGYGISKKLIVRVILRYTNFIIEGENVILPGIYKLVLRNIGESQNKKGVVKIKTV